MMNMKLLLFALFCMSNICCATSKYNSVYNDIMLRYRKKYIKKGLLTKQDTIYFEYWGKIGTVKNWVKIIGQPVKEGLPNKRKDFVVFILQK